MERDTQFSSGEFYHIYNRGIDKRKIFFSSSDWRHFQKLLWARNMTDIYIRSDRLSEIKTNNVSERETLVDICVYVLMDNHFHFVLKEKQEGGISKFMGKLLTSHSMYMNKKYERTGPLMCRPYRSRHINGDDYFRWLISYIHLNPLDKFQSGFKENGLHDIQKAAKFLKEYKYSSYIDYFSDSIRSENMLLNGNALPIDIASLENLEEMIQELNSTIFQIFKPMS